MALSNRRLTSTNSFPALSSPENEEDMPPDLTLSSLLDSVPEGSSATNYDLRYLHTKDLQLRWLLSFTMSYVPLAVEPEEGPFKRIGGGACGAVFAQEGKPLAIKLAKTDDQMLLNDYQKHELIEQQFRKWDFTEVLIPDCHLFVPKEDSLRFSERPDLAEAAEYVCHLPTSALATQRIPPLCELTRTLLIEKYCAPSIKELAHSERSNKDCLVRIYLGSVEGKGDRKFFSLRNFKLHFNQMVDIKLDVEKMAARMGVAMALMHWAAETDARDIEFVLGTDRRRTAPNLRSTELWVLDFNQVQSITMDEAGVAKAVEAATINDPYLPRPLGESQIEKQAWNVFAGNYISAANTIFEGKDQELLKLPRMFLRGLIEYQKIRKRVQQRLAVDMQLQVHTVDYDALADILS